MSSPVNACNGRRGPAFCSAHEAKEISIEFPPIKRKYLKRKMPGKLLLLWLRLQGALVSGEACIYNTSLPVNGKTSRSWKVKVNEGNLAIAINRQQGSFANVTNKHAPTLPAF